MEWVAFARHGVICGKRPHDAGPELHLISAAGGDPRDEAQVCTSLSIGQRNRNPRGQAGAHFLYSSLFLHW